MGFGRACVVIPAVIAAGNSLSAAVDLGGLRLAGIEMPAGWTSAGLTFQAASSGFGSAGGPVQRGRGGGDGSGGCRAFHSPGGGGLRRIEMAEIALRHIGHAGQPGGGTDVEIGAGGGGVKAETTDDTDGHR